MFLTAAHEKAREAAVLDILQRIPQSPPSGARELAEAYAILVDHDGASYEDDDDEHEVDDSVPAELEAQLVY